LLISLLQAVQDRRQSLTLQKLQIARFSVLSSRPFESVLTALKTALAQPAGSYAPVTVLVDERSHGVHVSYDKMVSLLTGYGNPDALAVAELMKAARDGARSPNWNRWCRGPWAGRSL
jgi:hypothetical protein